MTKDLNPLEPKILEYKFYARGVGPVLAIGVSGGSDREELVSYTRGKSGRTRGTEEVAEESTQLSRGGSSPRFVPLGNLAAARGTG